MPIPPNYPVVGRDAFRTATGVHAAAVIKAFRKKDQALVDAVYSGVPASLVGREQEIEVGPMSGKSNVVFWLEKRGLPVTDGDRRSDLREGEGVGRRCSTESEIRALELDRPESVPLESAAAENRSRIAEGSRSGHGAAPKRSANRSGYSLSTAVRRYPRQRREDHVADRLQDCGRHLVERVVGACARRGSRGR